MFKELEKEKNSVLEEKRMNKFLENDVLNKSIEKGKLDFNSLSLKDEEFLAHSSMGTTSETYERRKQGLSDYDLTNEKMLKLVRKEVKE